MSLHAVLFPKERQCLFCFTTALEGVQEKCDRQTNNSNKGQLLKLETVHVHIYKVIPQRAHF